MKSIFRVPFFRKSKYTTTELEDALNDRYKLLSWRVTDGEPNPYNRKETCWKVAATFEISGKEITVDTLIPAKYAEAKDAPSVAATRIADAIGHIIVMQSVRNYEP